LRESPDGLHAAWDDAAARHKRPCHGAHRSHDRLVAARRARQTFVFKGSGFGYLGRQLEQGGRQLNRNVSASHHY
jgi:hypothetical protein